MNRKNCLALPLLLILASGCATLDDTPEGSARAAPGVAGSTADAGTTDSTPDAGDSGEPIAPPELIARLPQTLESFDYAGYRYFRETGAGYTVRYENARKKRTADVYIYPVARENLSMEHNQLVMGSTRATLEAIGKAVAKGLYANFTVVGAATQARGARTVARVKTTYLRDNLASYSLLYQTEYEGTLVKIRINMPDNEFNRDSAEWDRFSLQVLDLVIGKQGRQREGASGTV